jgi:hypothetical protein
LGGNKTDVEAAAELGRTLLERNRELESTVRQQQAVIDDQTQEMEVKSKEQLTNKLTNITREKRVSTITVAVSRTLPPVCSVCFCREVAISLSFEKKKHKNVDEDKTYFYI